KLVGDVKEEKGITENDPVFEMIITYFENKASFTQRINLTGDKGTTIKGEVEFMVCDDTNCLPPTYVDLVFDIPAPASTAATDNPESTEDVETEPIEATTGTEDLAGDNIDSIESEGIPGISNTPDNSSGEALEQTEKEEQRGLWTIFILSFLFGFTALLTPCIFPMIPMTV